MNSTFRSHASVQVTFNVGPLASQWPQSPWPLIGPIRLCFRSEARDVFDSADGTDSNRKWTVFLLNLSSRYHICIVEYISSLVETISLRNLAETNVLGCEMFPSGFRPWLKNVFCVSSLITSRVTQNLIRIENISLLESHVWWFSSLTSYLLVTIETYRISANDASSNRPLVSTTDMASTKFH